MTLADAGEDEAAGWAKSEHCGWLDVHPSCGAARGHQSGCGGEAARLHLHEPHCRIHCSSMKPKPLKLHRRSNLSDPIDFPANSERQIDVVV